MTETEAIEVARQAAIDEIEFYAKALKGKGVHANNRAYARQQIIEAGMLLGCFNAPMSNAKDKPKTAVSRTRYQLNQENLK